MEDTVSELLDLARLDESDGPRPLASLPEVDLDELVLDDTVRPRRVPVDTARVSAGRVHGRREQLPRVVRNLLDNAARHAARRGRRRAASTDDGTVELTVDDDGPGIPPRTASACSSASPASTTAGPATPAASGSGCRW